MRSRLGSINTRQADRLQARTGRSKRNLSLSIGQNRADQGLKAASAELFLQFERVDISDTILALTQILTDGALILNELRKVVCILRHTT
jgi:hypothetical protein